MVIFNLIQKRFIKKRKYTPVLNVFPYASV